MPGIGAAARLARLLPAGRGVWIPLDHGLTLGPVSRLAETGQLVDEICRSGADAIISHKGMIREPARLTSAGCGWVVHLSASTIHGGQFQDHKVQVGEVEEAVSLGADAVSVHVNIGAEGEPEMLATMAKVADEARHFGMPLLGMVYPRGPNLSIDPTDTTKGVAHGARVAFELGCDVVKVPWTGDIDSFSIVTKGVDIPVLLAGGGAEQGLEAMARMVEDSIAAGGSGVSIGRHVFTHSSPARIIRILHGLVHEGLDSETLLKE